MIGATRAHKAVTLLIAALRTAGYALLTLQQASSQHRIADSSLRTLVDEQRIRCRYRHRGGRETILFDPNELAADLGVLPKCRAPGCQAPGMGRSGCCGEHFSYGGRDRARAREDEALNDPDRDWYTAEEAAKRLGVFPAAIQAMIDRGELVGERVGLHWQIPKRAVEQLRKARRGRPRQTMPTADQTPARRQEVRRLVEQGNLSAPQIARQVDVDKATLYRDLRVLNLDPPGDRKPSRRLSAEEVAQVRDRYAEGGTLAELGDQFDVSPGQVRDRLDELGVHRRAAGTRPKYPTPTERQCAHCDEAFTPKARASWDQRFCTNRCADKARRDARRAALTEHGLLSAQEVADRLGLSQGSVYVLRSTDRSTNQLVGEQVVTRFGDSVWGVAEAELDRFLRDRSRGEGSNDGRRLRWLDPDQGVEQLRRMGLLDRKAKKHQLTLAETETLERDRIAHRRKQFRRRRQGRRPGAGPSERSLRWKSRFDELWAELQAAYEQDMQRLQERCDADWEQLGAQAQRTVKPPTRHDVCEAIFEEDWRQHRSAWGDGYPAAPQDPDSPRSDCRKQGANTIWNGIKPLLNAVTEISVG